MEELDWLALLQNDRKAQEVELTACKRDPWRFLTYWAHTIDTADGDNPEKLFPNKIHLYTCTRYWQKFPTLLIPKSRQLSMTWLCCGLYLWESMFYGHRLTFFQSKKEQDAAELIIRMYQMWSSLPVWMREWNHCEKIYAYAEFHRSKSRVFGIPSGASQVRGFTPSAVFVDEASYVLEMDQMLAAIRPAIRSGGRLTVISSAAPGFFSAMVLDGL